MYLYVDSWFMYLEITYPVWGSNHSLVNIWLLLLLDAQEPSQFELFLAVLCPMAHFRIHRIVIFCYNMSNIYVKEHKLKSSDQFINDFANSLFFYIYINNSPFSTELLIILVLATARAGLWWKCSIWYSPPSLLHCELAPTMVLVVTIIPSYHHRQVIVIQ